MNCVELYKAGQWAETPTGIGQKNFRKKIVVWARIAELQSMSRKGNCYDNSIMETFFGRLKNEMFFWT